MPNETIAGTITVRRCAGVRKDRPWHPVCDQAKRFVALTRTPTLSVADIEIIKQLGFAVLEEDD